MYDAFFGKSVADSVTVVTDISGGPITQLHDIDDVLRAAAQYVAVACSRRPYGVDDVASLRRQ